MTSTVSSIREQFANLHRLLPVVPDLEIGGTLELIGSSFEADEPTIFGAVSEEYVERELEWYLSMSRKVEDIPGVTPKIWQQVASEFGTVNSNYGYLMLHRENYSQFRRVLEQLKAQRGYGRRGVAVYTRPSIHLEWNKAGMSDFICTNAVNYYERHGELNAVVQMRSNDAIFGYRNDFAWQTYVLESLAEKLGVKSGTIVWQAGSLHVYKRHYHLIENFAQTGVADGDL